MSPTEAFKYAFMRRCADEGLTPAETAARAATAARIKQGSFFGSATHQIANLGKLGLGAALVAPPAIGAAGGYALSGLADDGFDPEEAKRDEELAELYRAIDMLSRRHV
jgi:hypothetical protein